MRQTGRGRIWNGIWAVAWVAGFVGTSQAQNGTWTGGSGVDNNWNTAGNWVDGVIPGDWQSAFFSSGVVNGTVNNNAWIGHNAITVDASCPMDIVINGPYSVPQQLAPITVTGANLTFNTDLNVWDSAITFNVAEGKALTFNGRINNGGTTPTAARVTINGAGTVVMTQAGLYTGGTVVNGGTLKTTAANGAGPGAMTVGSGAAWDRGIFGQAVAGLSGAGHVICTNAGGVVITGPDGAAQISTNKNYVHVLDFEPSGGGGATVNGVKFTGVGTSGPGWSLTGTANTFGENATLTGYDRLLSGFFYGSTGTLTFSDLVVGNTYEIVVFSSPAWGTRYEDATFTNGTDSHVLQHTNPGDYGYYAYTFLATDSTASITMAPYDTGNTFHWYGATLAIVPPTLTVGDANDYLFSGVIDGGAALVKQGSGVQTLAGANAYTEGTKVNAGALNTAAAGGVGSGAVAVASGATWQLRAGAHQTVAGLSGAGTVAAYSAGAVSTGADGAALISTGKNYLKLLDFGNGSGATVNGVTFDNASATSGTGWSLLLNSSDYTYFADSGSGYGQLMSDFLYNGNPGVLAFHNLTVGKCYDVVLYAQVGVWGGRWQNATFANGPDSVQLLGVDEGAVGYYSYQFKAQAETATITMIAVNPANTFHWFAASLETLADNTFTNGVTLTLGDANDYRFAGAINGNLSLVKRGSGKQTLAGPVAYTGPTTISEGTLRLELPSAPAGAVTVANASFETHDALANDTWGYNPTGASWTFDAASGIAAPGSPWVAANATPDGTYAAFIQNNGTLSQAVTIPADGNYLLTFKAANRPGYSASGLNLLIDGVTNYSFAASAFNSQGGFQKVSALAQIGAGTHTLTLAGVMTGSDSATAIDNVSITGIGGSLSTNAPVSIARGACLDLGGTTQTVSRLYFDGTEKQPGTHGAPGSGAQYTHANWFTGSGVLKVLNGKIYSTLVVIR